MGCAWKIGIKYSKTLINILDIVTFLWYHYFHIGNGIIRGSIVCIVKS